MTMMAQTTSILPEVNISGGVLPNGKLERLGR